MSSTLYLCSSSTLAMSLKLSFSAANMPFSAVTAAVTLLGSLSWLSSLAKRCASQQGWCGSHCGLRRQVSRVS